jgi:hypothetical protein
MTFFRNIKVFDHDVLLVACRTTGNSLTRCSTCCSAVARGSAYTAPDGTRCSGHNRRRSIMSEV